MLAGRAKVLGRTDQRELEGHRPGESIEGFGKRLPAVMDGRGWDEVKKLAAEFLKPKRKEHLAKWRDEQGLIRLDGVELGGWFRRG